LGVENAVAPLKEGLLRTSVGIITKLSLVDLETQNESPDETKDKTGVLVHNIFGTDVNEADVLLLLHVLEAVVQVLKLLERSLGSLDHLGELLAAENLEQSVEAATIVHILLEKFDNEVSVNEVTVAPTGERLQMGEASTESETFQKGNGNIHGADESRARV
jgi:hypothetical protein